MDERKSNEERRLGGTISKINTKKKKEGRKEEKKEGRKKERKEEKKEEIKKRRNKR